MMGVLKEFSRLPPTCVHDHCAAPFLTVPPSADVNAAVCFIFFRNCTAATHNSLAVEAKSSRMHVQRITWTSSSLGRPRRLNLGK